MDIGTLSGLVGGAALIVIAILMGGGIGGFINIPSVVVVVGGSVAVTFIMFPIKVVTGSVKVAAKAFLGKSPDPMKDLNQLVNLAERARKESLVALEKVSIDDPFLKRGLQLVADGTEESIVRSIMSIEIDNMRSRHKQGMNVFKGMGTYAPAFGMIGTLIGLVRMLQTLEDPDTIGPAMAVALLTTFYGVILANLVCLPIAQKLQERSGEEIHIMEMQLEGIVAILNGEHPTIVKEKLLSFLPTGLRQTAAASGGKKIK